MHLFYTPDIKDNVYTLNEVESKHCSKVLRLTKGENINLIDGKGNFYTATIIDDHPKKCTIEVIEKKEKFNHHDYFLHIAIAPTKNIDRFEWFLEKATEIGINEITPLLCEHSERKVIKLERLEKIIVSAMKQSYKATLPKLNPLTSYKDFISTCTNKNKIIAHSEYFGPSNAGKLIHAKESICILIGPEGDFSEEEIRLAKENSFKQLSLGRSRLRTETAGIAACHSVYLINDL